MELPAAFLARMGDLLKEDTPRFLKSLEEEPHRAFRFDPLRLSREDLVFFLGDGVKEQVPFEDSAFYFEKDGIGNTLPHIGGGIYVQEPAAMAPVSALDEKEEVRAALDLCAAPGGKSLQAAQRLLSQEGFLVCNEPDPQRRKALIQNLERLGEKRASVSGFDAVKLPAAFQERFDLVIADVPCSGEGMMRKNEAAWKTWNEGNIRALAALQQSILESAARALAPGGRLLYSTCTWSREENEENISRFLSLHPDFSLIPPREEVSRRGAPGEIPHTLRFYPHLFPGEGQFLAVLRKAGKIPPRETERKGKEKKGKKDAREEVVASRRPRKKFISGERRRILSLLSLRSPIFSSVPACRLGACEKGDLSPIIFCSEPMHHPSGTALCWRRKIPGSHLTCGEKRSHWRKRATACFSAAPCPWGA